MSLEYALLRPGSIVITSRGLLLWANSSPVVQYSLIAQLASMSSIVQFETARAASSNIPTSMLIISLTTNHAITCGLCMIVTQFAKVLQSAVVQSFACCIYLS